MSAELVEAPIIVTGWTPNWATTTASTVEKDSLDVSVASEEAVALDRTLAFAVVPYARTRSRSSYPPSSGKTMLFEGTLEQVGYVEDAIATSTLIPRLIAAPARTLPFAHPYQRLTLPQTYRDEVLDWDAYIEVAPADPSGTIIVALEYGGQDTPKPPDDYWE